MTRVLNSQEREVRDKEYNTTYIDCIDRLSSLNTTYLTAGDNEYNQLIDREAAFNNTMGYSSMSAQANRTAMSEAILSISDALQRDSVANQICIASNEADYDNTVGSRW